MPTRRHLLSVLALVLFAALLLPSVGCSALGDRLGTQSVSPGGGGTADYAAAPPVSSGGSYGGAPEAKGTLETSARDAASSGGSVATAQQLVIRTKSMTLTVKDAKKDAKAVQALAKRFGGYVTDASISSQGDGGPSPLPYQEQSGGAPSGSDKAGPFVATLTVKVPGQKFEGLIEEVRKLGDVRVESESQEDVTQQHADLSARLKNLRAEETRLQQFFKMAKNVREALEVERELARVRGDIESLVAQLDVLNKSVALATLTMTLQEPSKVISPAGPAGWGFVKAVTQAVRNFVDVVNFLIMLGGGLLPIIFIIVALYYVLRWISRRGRERKMRSQPGAADEGSAADEGGAAEG